MRNACKEACAAAGCAARNHEEQVTDEELQALAQRRAEALRLEFEAQGKLPADKLAVEPIEKVEAADKKTVQSKFSLTTK
jgi:hypothetical protein